MELVLKTSDTARYRGFESHLLRHFLFQWKRRAEDSKFNIDFYSEKYPRGRRGSPAKGVVRENRSEGSNPSFSAKQRHSPNGECFCLAEFLWRIWTAMERCLWQEERHCAPRARERERANPSFSAKQQWRFFRRSWHHLEHIVKFTRRRDVFFFYAKNSEKDLNGHGMKCKKDPENRF